MFDPETVERSDRQSLGLEEERVSTVLASDYDKLLQLYRDLLEEVRDAALDKAVEDV